MVLTCVSASVFALHGGPCVWGIPCRVGGPWGVGLLLRLRLGDLPASGDVVPGQLHTPVVVDGFDLHDGELPVLLSYASEKDASPAHNLSWRMPPNSPASTSPAEGSLTSCHPTQSALEKT